jgi:hypothetical protein
MEVSTMRIARGFHAEYQTDVDDEICLARELSVSARLRWGMLKLPRMMRTDPAAVLGKMMYCRAKNFFGVPCGCVMGVPGERESRATNDYILTPSHPEWIEFQERLEAHLACPDFGDYYGAAQMVFHDSIETEYWPLCSAQLIAELGFAVAESLCVFKAFLGDTDERIAEHVERMWRKTRPSKIRPAFDRDPLTPFTREPVRGRESPQ